MGATLQLAVALALLATAARVQAQYRGAAPTPVPILKHINRHNEDGSYSYGYENADGSYKIETKHPTGEVFGKYGYVDDTGKAREVEYGASRRGFEPAGAGINVPPPTLHSSHSGPDGYDDGQYREDPSVYYKDERFNSRSSSRPSFQHRFQHQPRYDSPPPPPQQNYNPAPNYYNPPPAPHRPSQYDHNLFRGHPATNFDVNTGSYSVTYSG